MSENSKIEWTDHTFNPWIGCTKVSPGCAHCYAERDNARRKWNPAGWGKGAERKRTSAGNWKEPLRWNRQAGLCKCGRVQSSVLHDCEFGRCDVDYRTKQKRPRVFCASLADWLDDEVPIEWLAELLALIHVTPKLDWLLLTKRPENWESRLRHVAVYLQGRGGHIDDGTWQMVHAWLPWNGIVSRTPPANVWIGTSVEDQARADERIPALLQIPAKVRFLSCEPLLEAVEFSNVTRRADAVAQLGKKALAGIHWVIAGGESGPGARPMHPDWARSLRDQCTAAGVPFLFKQWGEWAACEIRDGNSFSYSHAADIKSPKNPEFLHWCNRIPGDPAVSARIGKKAAGRQLDGVEWNNFPEVA